MKKREYSFLNFFNVIMLFLGCYFSTYSQTNTAVPDQLVEQFQNLTKNTPADLVYLQTSKGIYETEEDVWFKGYVLDAQTFTPSARSKTLFVQLIEDKTDKVVWEKKYEIENGFVNGHLFLENTLPEGIYTLTGYSSYSFTQMPKEFYSLKKITIVKTINSKAVVNPVEKDSIVHFSTFPEGGKLVSGIQSNLAFKAVNSKGFPVDISGTLFENNIPLLNFKSSHAGMGVFAFTPDNSKKYHIQLTEPKLKTNFDIGGIESNGKVLSLLRNNKEALTFKITQGNNSKTEKVYLRLQVRGIVYSIATGVLNKELVIKIPLKDVPQGIAEVTLFDENALPVAERLVFVNQEQKLTIKTEIDKSSYSTREKVTLKIKVIDQDNQAVVAHLGLSVYDDLYQNKLDSKNIQSHFLLSTQLKGNIYNPTCYFNEQNNDRNQALDLLMLTQGWRNYIWDEVNLRDLGSRLPPIVFDEIKGKVQLKNQNQKATVGSKKTGITVFAADEKKGKDFIITDSTGVFTISPNHLKIGEGSYTYLQLMNPEKSIYRMDIKDFSFKEIDRQRKIKTLFYPLEAIVEKTNTKEIAPFVGRNNITKLNEVVITSKKKGQVFRDKYIGKLDSLYRANHFTKDWVCADHWGSKYGNLNCQQLECHGGLTKKPVEGEKYWQMLGYEKLNDSPCSDFKITIGTFEVTYHYPDLTEDELLKMFNIAMVEGYYGKKVFYEAVYDEVSITDSFPDSRNTLFWKSDIITNEQGEASVQFFCSDINSLFVGNIEGVSGDGLLGAENFQFSVKKRN